LFTARYGLNLELELSYHRVKDQVVSQRLLTATTRVRYQVCSCEIFGDQSGTGTCLSPRTSEFPCQCHSSNYTILIIIHMLLLREGQTGQALEPPQNECFFKNLEVLDEKILSLFFFFALKG